jgi:hypothetical protein
VALPNRVQINVAAGSQWSQGYQLQNDDGTIFDITGIEFRFVVRPTTTDSNEPALVSVDSNASTAQGYITVTVDTATLLVVLSPTATTLLGQSVYPYSLWMAPGTAAQTDLVQGVSFCTLVALP